MARKIEWTSVGEARDEIWHLLTIDVHRRPEGTVFNRGPDAHGTEEGVPVSQKIVEGRYETLASSKTFSVSLHSGLRTTSHPAEHSDWVSLVVRLTRQFAPLLDLCRRSTLSQYNFAPGLPCTYPVKLIWRATGDLTTRSLQFVDKRA